MDERQWERRYLSRWGFPHGKWLRTDGYPHRIYCSECHATYLQNEELARDFEFPKNFCPNCGIPMDLEEIQKKERMKAYGCVCDRYTEENAKELLKKYLQIDADLRHGVRMNGTATTLHTLRWAYKKVLREKFGWTVGELRRLRKNTAKIEAAHEIVKRNIEKLNEMAAKQNRGRFRVVCPVCGCYSEAATLCPGCMTRL